MPVGYYQHVVQSKVQNGLASCPSSPKISWLAKRGSRDGASFLFVLALPQGIWDLFNSSLTKD